MKMNFARIFASCVIMYSAITFSYMATDEMHALRKPIDFSGSGINGFLQTTFNHPVYAREILPHDFSHFIQLLQNSKEVGPYQRTYIKSVLKLFNNKLKGLPYINAYEFSLTLEQFSEILESAFSPNRMLSLQDCHSKIYTIMEQTFLHKFDLFKEKPREFLTSLSNDILQKIQETGSIDTEEVSIDQLSQTVIRFLETSLNKLIWSPEEHEIIWESVKSIAHSIEDLIERSIITDSSDLDDLYWSLIHRFCFFIDITGSDLPIEFYEKIRNDIASQELLFLELEEQEEALETKLTCFKRALFHSEAKKRALDNGIIAH